MEDLDLAIERNQMRWLGHVLRMPPERMARKMLEAEPEGPRPVGRPRTRWLDQTTKICQRAGVRTDRIKVTADDRIGWRRQIADLPPLPVNGRS